MQQTLCISSQGLQCKKNKKYKSKSKATRKFFLLWLCFSKEDRLQGCNCIYCGGAFSFGENYQCISFDIIFYIQSENMTIVFTKIVNMLAEVSAM